MERISDWWRGFWALSWRAKAGVIIGSILTVSVAVIAGVALIGGSGDQKTEVGKPARTPAAVVRQVTPTPTAISSATEEPSPTTPQNDPIATEPTPTAVASSTPTQDPSGAGGGDPSTDDPTTTLQAEEAKALAIDWLVAQGGLWLDEDNTTLYLADGPEYSSLRLYVSACWANWESGRWTISCPDSGYVLLGLRVAHVSVDEATLLVAWHEPPLTTSAPLPEL